ncbi:MAG: Na(+)-translocating NADH-quinone reductase subunit A, partial [Porphyromonadaceae bacterium]|nr:Na(+)-translocating NADH-quinone reductase subunit A [Porphyromonadaceae bacterium]
PKVIVQPGMRVLAGEALLAHKAHPELKLTSPVSGEVVAVHRGEKRKVLSVEVRPEATIEYKEYATADALSMERSQLLSLLLESGMFSFFKQRPYDRIANPLDTPRDIFVTANLTAPLAPKFAYLVKGREHELQLALDALTRLTPGKVYLGVGTGELTGIRTVERVEVRGPHPAGLVGVLINHTAPVNKGEVVWTLKATDLLVIGRFLKTGRVDFSRTIALTGSEAKELGYVKVLPGARFEEVLAGRLAKKDSHERIIEGDVFTGVKVDEAHDRMSFGIDQITIIPEGDDQHEVLGWALPRFKQFSMSRTYFSWLMPGKEYALDARIKGGRRAMIMSGQYDSVFPMDIYPEFLLKSLIAFNIDDMEARGIYEVAPEDFSVCEFVDTSKIPLQQLVRQGLDELYKEMN